MVITDMLIADIKARSDLTSLENSFVKDRLQQVLKRNAKFWRIIQEKFDPEKKDQIKKAKEYRLIIKETRKILREVYGVFLKDDFAKKTVDTPPLELLKLHQSTAERIPYYLEIYRNIFQGMDNKDIQIVDLACGMNPVSAVFLRQIIKQEFTYHAYDLSVGDMAFIDLFFKKNKLNGDAQAFDLLTGAWEELLPKKGFKVVFLWKALDSLETVHRHVSKKFLAFLLDRMDIVVVSFPTKTIGGKKSIDETKRNWLSTFLKKLDKEYCVFEVENEIFYKIEKK